MRSKFLFLCLFLFGMLTACKDTKWVDVPTGTPPEGSVTENRAKLKNPMILILQIKHLSTVLISVVIFLKRIEFREQVWVLATI